jgi:DNA polymerase III epsilon subunit-like protein
MAGHQSDIRSQTRVENMQMNLIDLTPEEKWDLFEYVVVDIEGTGSQHKEREGVVDIAAILIRKGKVTRKVFQRLVNPEIEIPIFTSRIHGIFDVDVQDKPKFEEIRVELESFLANKILVAHNAKVEQRVLRLKIPTYDPPAILDTLKFAKTLYPQYPKHNLDELIEKLHLKKKLKKISVKWSRHSAYYDSLAAAYAFLHMVHEMFPQGCTLKDLLLTCGIESLIHKPIPAPVEQQQESLF